MPWLGNLYDNINLFFVFSLRVAIFYDSNFLRLNGGSSSASNTKINSIFNHVKTIYSSFQVSGVLGAIVPSLHSVTYKPGYWTADSSLRYETKYTYSKYVINMIIADEM